MGIKDNNFDSLLRQPSLGLRPRVRENITGKFLNYLVSYPAIYPSIYPSITLTIYLYSHLPTYLPIIFLLIYYLSNHLLLACTIHPNSIIHPFIHVVFFYLLSICASHETSLEATRKAGQAEMEMRGQRRQEAGAWLQLGTIACT